MSTHKQKHHASLSINTCSWLFWNFRWCRKSSDWTSRSVRSPWICEKQDYCNQEHCKCQKACLSHRTHTVPYKLFFSLSRPLSHWRLQRWFLKYGSASYLDDTKLSTNKQHTLSHGLVWGEHVRFLHKWKKRGNPRRSIAPKGKCLLMRVEYKIVTYMSVPVI